MANLREIRTHIKTIQETMKITNAMYLISSSKLKRAKKSLDQTVPYFEYLQTTIASIIDHSPDIRHQFFAPEKEKTEKKRGYIVISGDKGLCGGYNHNVVRFAEEQIANDENSTVFLIGAKGRKYFNNKKLSFEGEFLYVIQNPTTRQAASISDAILRLYRSEHLDEVYLVYTKMISSVKVEPQMIKLLPLEKTHFEKQESGKYRHIAFFSPSVKEVLDNIVPNYLKGVIYGALLESFASEQSARMIAMDGATDNAKKMLYRLSLEYNRARQSAITQQISEIVGGSIQSSSK